MYLLYFKFIDTASLLCGAELQQMHNLQLLFLYWNFGKICTVVLAMKCFISISCNTTNIDTLEAENIVINSGSFHNNSMMEKTNEIKTFLISHQISQYCFGLLKVDYIFPVSHPHYDFSHAFEMLILKKIIILYFLQNIISLFFLHYFYLCDTSEQRFAELQMPI